MLTKPCLEICECARLYFCYREKMQNESVEKQNLSGDIADSHTQRWTLTGFVLTNVKKVAFGLSSFSSGITQQMHAVHDLVSQCHWQWKAHQGSLVPV